MTKILAAGALAIGLVAGEPASIVIPLPYASLESFTVPTPTISVSFSTTYHSHPQSTTTRRSGYTFETHPCSVGCCGCRHGDHKWRGRPTAPSHPKPKHDWNAVGTTDYEREDATKEVSGWNQTETTTTGATGVKYITAPGVQAAKRIWNRIKSLKKLIPGHSKRDVEDSVGAEDAANLTGLAALAVRAVAADDNTLTFTVLSVEHTSTTTTQEAQTTQSAVAYHDHFVDHDYSFDDRIRDADRDLEDSLHLFDDDDDDDDFDAVIEAMYLEGLLSLDVDFAYLDTADTEEV